jgi:hypothetical protein
MQSQGNYTAKGTYSEKKTHRIILKIKSSDEPETPSNEKNKSTNQSKKSYPTGFNQKL